LQLPQELTTEISYLQDGPENLMQKVAPAGLCHLDAIGIGNLQARA
jgi:hypothetical protein